MSPRDFGADLVASQDQRIRSALDECYRQFFPPESILDIELVGRKQQRYGDVRIVLRVAGGATSRIWIEEKVRSRRWDDLLIEYQHIGADGVAWLGWVYTTNADWLAYAWLADKMAIEALILPVRPLREWFVPRLNQFDDRESQTEGRGGSYSTFNKVVPLDHREFVDFCRSYAVRPLHGELVS